MQMYYLDNLLCSDMIVDCSTTPHASLFSLSLIEKISKTDKKIYKNGLISYGNLNVSIFFCYALVLCNVVQLLFVLMNYYILYFLSPII